MRLVRLDNYQVVIEDELLLLTPFKKLYKSDKTRGKDNFFNFLTVVYFTFDPRSDYSYIANEELRLKEVCESNGFPYPREFNNLELECIELYRKLTTTLSQELLRSTRVAIDKLRTFLENVDFNERDDKGKLVFTPQALTAAIKQIPQLSKELKDAEQAIAKEIEEQGRARGGNESKSLMDDGILL